MIDSRQLDAACRQFETDGFTVIRNFLTPDEIARVTAEFDRYLRDIVPRLSKDEAYFEDRGRPETLFRLNRMGKFDPWFAEFVRQERYVSLASRLLGDDVEPKEASMFGKAPRIGGPTPPHQDNYYFKLDPPLALTCWMPLDRADAENGCVRYVPGSHTKGFRPHAVSEVYGFSLGIVDYDEADCAVEVKVEVDPGDMIIHHGMTVHRADPNPTDRLRRAIGLVYFGRRARPDEAELNKHADRLKKLWADRA